MTYDTINDDKTIAGNGEGTLLAGRYRIVRQLGQGGMGSVWLAEDTQLDDKPFAIKMLPSILVSNKRAYNQLKAEALVAMKLTHPNIVTLRAFEENNGNPFLVMDYIDGQTLDDYLAEHGSGVLTQRHGDTEAQSGRAGALRPPHGDDFGRVEHVERVEGNSGRGTRPACPSCGIPEADVLRILRPIAAALDYAHGKGVVHRDVKPGNVMIARDGTPYILDFGIAREIQETLTRVTGKLSSGTLLYMSPEQLMGEQPKPLQDVYSFAAMAYECLRGEPPFSHGQIEFQIMNKQPEHPPGGAQLVASVMSGLAKKPEERPPTCSALLEGNSLSRVEHVETVRVRVPRARTGGSRSRATASLAVAVLVLALVGAWWLSDRKAVDLEITDVPPIEQNATNPIEVAGIPAPTGPAGASTAAAPVSSAAPAQAAPAVPLRPAPAAPVTPPVAPPLAAPAPAAPAPAAPAVPHRPAPAARVFPSNPVHKQPHTITLPGGATMEMIYVAPSTFMMGSPVSEVGRDANETQHQVTLTKGYWLGKYEVTQAQWQSVMGSNPSKFQGGSRPVEQVSWEDCQRFIDTVNSQLNCGARLPTEAEWENACRAGTLGLYGGNGDLEDMGWYSGNSGRETHFVGRKHANAWGFHDMHGNVFEWCGDWYGNYDDILTDPTGPSVGKYRVVRGGGWGYDARWCRSALHTWFEPDKHSWVCGFRLCCSPELRE